MILLDTNLLARMTNSKHPHCSPSRRAVGVLSVQGQRIVIVPQNLYEFWAVATRNPGKPFNGLGMSCNRAHLWLQYFQRRFALLPDDPNLVPSWQALVNALGIRGIKSHDARLVAAMQAHGISRLLTFNANDFKGLPVTIVDPATV